MVGGSAAEPVYAIWGDSGLGWYRSAADTFAITTNSTLAVSVDGSQNMDVVGDITVGGTVDGRDVAADGALLDTAMQDLVDDTSPQLGSSLDVNGNEIQSKSGAAIILHSDGNVLARLGDTAGSYKLRVQASDNTNVFDVASDGDVDMTGLIRVNGNEVWDDGHNKYGSFYLGASGAATGWDEPYLL